MSSYPVTYMFQPIQGVDKYMTISQVTDQLLKGKEDQLAQYLDIKNEVIVILKKDGVDSAEFQYNYLDFINTRLSTSVTTANGLFDAGYVPYIYMPALVPSKGIPKEFISKLLRLASLNRIRLQKTSCSLLPSNFKADRNILDYWIRRADLRKLWDVVRGVPATRKYSDLESFSALEALKDIYTKGVAIDES